MVVVASATHPGPADVVIHSKTGTDIIYDAVAKIKIPRDHREFICYPGLVERAVRDPLFVVPSQRFGNCHAYVDYGLHPRYPNRYITVIVELDPKPARIKTAYTHPALKGWQQKGMRLYARP